jgi:choline dehydrogenase-like flavoprotein
MIRDFEQHSSGDIIQTDLCIIGGGAAGIAIASQFLGTPWRVLILESGGLRAEPETQALYEAEVVGLPHTGSSEGRFRTFGGSTTQWGGQLLPLSPIDFQERDWVENSGWPLGLDELDPYYRRALDLMGVEGAPFDEARWESFRTKPPELARGKFEYCFSQWATLRNRNFAISFGKALRASTNVDVLLHANVVDLEPGPGPAVRAAQIRTLSGKDGRVEARVFVVCCGGIETARLLLAARSFGPHGVGNDKDLVGRYFQDHLSWIVGKIVSTDRRRLQRIFDPYYLKNCMVTCKIRPSDTYQRELRLLNALAQVKFLVPPDSAFGELRKLVQSLQSKTLPKPSLQMARNLASGITDVGRLALGRVVMKRRPSMSHGEILLIVDTEQVPNRESRVRLGTTCDALGVPKAVVDWRLAELDWQSLQRVATLLSSEFERLGLGTVVPDPHPEEKPGWREGMRDTYHHMGTTRMGLSPEQGVVDSHCKIYGIDNFYIGSCSVFPTSGGSNPTLTMLALCLRIADQIKARGEPRHASLN